MELDELRYAWQVLGRQLEQQGAVQRELLREFEGIKADNSPETQGFFQKIKGFWDEMKG